MLETAADKSEAMGISIIRHKWYEDVWALVLGSFLVAMGAIFFSSGQVLTGGVSGASLILSYLTPYQFGVFFFVLNLPFYILAIMRMGWRFTLKTAAAVAMISGFSIVLRPFIGLEEVHPLLAAVFASGLVGIGIIILFRHGAGVGGASILAHFLQERGIMRAGIFLLIFDLTVLSAGIFVLPWQNLVFSVIGALVMNIEIAMNHRPGRYFGG